MVKSWIMWNTCIIVCINVGHIFEKQWSYAS